MILCLEDLKGMDRNQLIDHLIAEYTADIDKEYGGGRGNGLTLDKSSFVGITFLVAYESVGSWGCDSSSFFLFRKAGKLYEVHGSHCSCYGFEGQWEPQETSLVALKERARKGYVFSAGGYDGNETENQAQAAAKVLSMRGGA